MAAATEDRDPKLQYPPGGAAPIDVAASTTILSGTLVCQNGSGNAVPAADTAGYLVAGVAPQKVDNSAGSAGDKTITPVLGVYAEFAISGSTLDSTNIGHNVAALDDQTVRDVTGATNNVIVGVLRGIRGSNAVVEVGAHGPTDS